MQNLGKFKPNKKIKYPAITFIYLETSKPIDTVNRYENVEKLCQMICLATGMPADPEEIKISQNTTFENIFDKYKNTNYFKKGAVYGGRITYFNPLEKIVIYSHFLHKITLKSNDKFENALQTFCFAYELEMRKNPRSKYTLCTTLYLVSINQLADNPKTVCKGYCICSECGEKINMQHKSGSDRDEIEKLIKKLITGNNISEAVSLAKKMYNLRSAYIHRGVMSGKEKEGGFFAEVGSDKNNKLLEDLINLSNLNRILIELYLQYEAKK